MKEFEEDNIICELQQNGFCERLAKQVYELDCDSISLRLSTALLSEMGYSEEEIKDTLKYFERHGGYCDCEVLMNVFHNFC